MVCHLHLLLHYAVDGAGGPSVGQFHKAGDHYCCRGGSGGLSKAPIYSSSPKSFQRSFQEGIQLGHGQLHAQLLEESLKNVKQFLQAFSCVHNQKVLSHIRDIEGEQRLQPCLNLLSPINSVETFADSKIIPTKVHLHPPYTHYHRPGHKTRELSSSHIVIEIIHIAVCMPLSPPKLFYCSSCGSLHEEIK